MPETTACNMFKVSQLASGLGLQVICAWLFHSCFIFSDKRKERPSGT